MEIWEAIKQRRSVRVFTEQAVDEALLMKLIDAARWAPSAGNFQLWHFVIVSNPGQLRKIKAFAPGMCGNPPALIVICTDQVIAEKKGGRLGRDVITLMDSAIAAENMALAAVEQGLGT